MQHKIAIVIIGSEILTGDTVDKNGPWLTQTLRDHGHSIDTLITIPDDIEIMTDTILNSLSHSSIIIITGGLGPTKDDLTKQVLAKIFTTPLRESHQAKQITQKNYQRLHKIYKPELNFYHHFPEGFEPINNPRGLAPGLFHQTSEKILMALPGVPAECMAMFEEEMLPRIPATHHGNHQCMIRTHGAFEEIMFGELAPNLWDQLSQFGKISSLPRMLGGIDIVVNGNKPIDTEKITNLIKNSAIWPYVWQVGNLSLPEYVLKIAREKKLSIACAESCTGGLIASRLTDISGSSENFLGSVVCYANEVKINLLQVEKTTLEKHGAVSEQTAEAMAQGVLNKLNADVAISTSGIAGPNGGSKEKPVGTVCIGFANHQKSGAMTKKFNGERMELKNRFSQAALFMLLDLMNSVD